jgi:hypothetical protein
MITMCRRLHHLLDLDAQVFHWRPLSPILLINSPMSVRSIHSIARDFDHMHAAHAANNQQWWGLLAQVRCQDPRAAGVYVFPSFSVLS